MKARKFLQALIGIMVSSAMSFTSYAREGKFQLSYNKGAACYEVHFVTQKAYPLLGSDLIVGPGSVSIVLPAGAPDVPLKITPVKGGAWAAASKPRYAPAAAPSSDYHMVTTTGDVISFAPVTSMPAGTDILLFTFTIGSPAQYVADARLFRNWAGRAAQPSSAANNRMQWPNLKEEGTLTPDPSSAKLGGRNFNNAFQTAPHGNSYRGNLSNKGTENEEKLAKAGGLKVYPLPVDDLLNISFDVVKKGRSQISLINDAGVVQLTKSVDTNEGVNFYSLNVSGLRSGMYFLKVNGHTSQVRKVLIMHQ